MEPDSLPTELILSDSQQVLGQLDLEWMPQPGTHVDFEGITYQVLERRHRYQLRANRYQLQKIALFVKTVFQSEESSHQSDYPAIGDVSCRYNARSELLRCAINPKGPCASCQEYAPDLPAGGNPPQVSACLE